MAAFPITIFSSVCDLAGIAALLRRMSPETKIVGPDGDWERISIEQSRGWLRKPAILAFKHNPEYYQGTDWSKQISGMQAYLSRFPDIPRKPEILHAVSFFKFALATEFQPDLLLETNDPRLQFLYAVARHLKGVIFIPPGLWDFEGRRLLTDDGTFDPNAVLPVVASGRASAEVPPDQSEKENHNQTDAPNPLRVARRALCLASVSARAFLETEEMSRESAESERGRILSWIGELALEDELEQKELQILRQPVGTLEQQDAIDAAWRLEGLVVLLWALGKTELPPYDQVSDARDLFRAAGFLDLNKSMDFLSAPTLLPSEHLQVAQQQFFALHWRLRNFALRPISMDFRSFAQQCWFGPLDISLARFSENDLAIGELPIAAAPESEFRTSLSIMAERHIAINWLVDRGKIYSEVDNST